ncbi:hypothetical protein [Candidatus Vondammii sp. HM_W22]|uniref:hypothetical protein n=1 Tax=Candidatus Vondammii sp. HM_W22 TaxID=2687299 RepID=UPI001F12F5B3|nr:hypothetical protein [Candidatus Vondammii sp. HM_W22]
MDIAQSEIIKQREIVFAEMHPNPDQAKTAVLLLTGIEGILTAEREEPTLLSIRYNLMQVSLEQIESALIETGFHLNSKLIFKLRRALYYYTEETQRANCGCQRGDNGCTRKIFVNRYQQMDHRCRDHRPEYWRKYL